MPGSQLLPLLSEMEVRLGGWMPFGRVTEFLKDTMRTTCSKATVHRDTLAAGEALVEAETKAAEWLLTRPRESKAPAVAHLQISVDGAMVPVMAGPWREVKTVAIGEIIDTEAGAKAINLSYFSRMSEHGEFARLATLETHRRGTDKAVRITAVVDGADWIQEFLDLHCPTAVRVIDWAHSSGYVARAAKALFADAGEGADWRGVQLNALLHGDPQDVLDELCRQLSGCTVGTTQEDEVATCLGYLAKRLEQIQYRRFRKEGRPIGSGIVESANKLVVEMRLKGAGMRWDQAHVSAMVALRDALCTSGRWRDSWRQLDAYRRRVATEHARAAHQERHPDPQEPPPDPAPPPPKRRSRSFRDFSLRGSRPRAKL